MLDCNSVLFPGLTLKLSFSSAEFFRISNLAYSKTFCSFMYGFLKLRDFFECW